MHPLLPVAITPSAVSEGTRSTSAQPPSVTSFSSSLASAKAVQGAQLDRNSQSASKTLRNHDVAAKGQSSNAHTEKQPGQPNSDPLPAVPAQPSAPAPPLPVLPLQSSAFPEPSGAKPDLTAATMPPSPIQESTAPLVASSALPAPVAPPLQVSDHTPATARNSANAPKPTTLAQADLPGNLAPASPAATPAAPDTSLQATTTQPAYLDPHPAQPPPSVDPAAAPPAEPKQDASANLALQAVAAQVQMPAPTQLPLTSPTQPDTAAPPASIKEGPITPSHSVSTKQDQPRQDARDPQTQNRETVPAAPAGAPDPAPSHAAANSPAPQLPPATSAPILTSSHAANPQPLPSPAVDPTPAINTARVLQSMEGSEMRVGMHSVEFGSVSVSTLLTHQSIAAEITFEHAALGQALSAHLPAMQARLSSEYGVHARVEVRDQNLGSSGNGEGGRSMDQGQAQNQARGAPNGDRLAANSLPGVASGGAREAYAGSPGRLDIRI